MSKAKDPAEDPEEEAPPVTPQGSTKVQEKWVRNCLQYVLMLAIIFVWVWALPILMVGFCLAAPFALVLLPLSLAISFALQFYYFEDRGTTLPPLRWVNR
jgi:hypothetical protein